MKCLPPFGPQLAHEFLAGLNKVNTRKKKFNTKSHKTSA